MVRSFPHRAGAVKSPCPPAPRISIFDSRRGWFHGAVDAGTMDPPPHDGLPGRPTRIRLDEPLAPRRPWSFWRAALPGGFSGWGLHLLAAWVLFQALGSAAWAQHLRGFAGFGPGREGGSGLPSHWGGLLTSRDAWELLENGGLKRDPVGPVTAALGLAALAWALWAGWRLQAARAGGPGGFRPWLYGALDALLIGLPPLALLGALLLAGLSWLGGLGFAWLGWLDLAGGALLRLTLASLLMVQWWFCRLARDQDPAAALLPGGWRAWGGHLRVAFVRLWLHPVHWGAMALLGSLLRAGLSLLALWAGWRMGGDGPVRVWVFLLLQVLAAAAGAWLLGWFLRVAALFLAQDRLVRRVKAELEAQVAGAESPHA